MTLAERIKQTATSVWEASKESEEDYWLARFLFLRVLGLVYLAAFGSLALQIMPLFGSSGILPVETFVESAAAQLGGTVAGFTQLPSIFWFVQSDAVLLAGAWLGVVLSLVLLLGYANVPLVLTLWGLYMSYVNVGQVFYSYGWESQLLETGLQSVFLLPLWNPRPFALRPPPLLVWLLRWLTMRIHLGAGLIKLRGDACWRKLTCLGTHFETQPIPNPLSPWFHHLPSPVHKLGVLYNHVAELVAPFTALAEPLARGYNRAAEKLTLLKADIGVARGLRLAGGAVMLGLQVVLILSGNLSFLNWLTIAPLLSFFDDRFLERFLPQRLVAKAREAKEAADPVSTARHAANWLLVLAVVLLSVPVVVNLASPNQAMNTSFNRLKLVNTYGAFGSIWVERPELIVEGTQDPTPGPGTEWTEYHFAGKPGDPDGPLPVVAPYQPRVPWQFWFAAVSEPAREPWLLHLTWMLLQGNDQAEKLLSHNSFPDDPPEYIRIQLYHYEFTEPGEAGTWNRELVGTWLPPVSRNSTELREYVHARWG